jgi:dephospho-CoA kinase
MRLSFKESLIFFTLRCVGQLSLRKLHALAAFVNFLLSLFPLRMIRFKRTIYINISRCMPELTPTELKRLVDDTTFHTIVRMLEMMFFWFAPLDKVKALKWETVNEEGYKNATHASGMITLYTHFGAWEALNYYGGTHYSLSTLYKPFKKAYQEILLKIARERFGINMFPANVSGIKSLFQALKSGKCICIPCDHDPGDNGGMYVPFFNIPANTTTLVAKFAKKTTASIYFVTAERLPKGAGFRIHFIPGLEALRAPNPQDAVRALNAQMADMIKLFPEQHEWSYKRFRRTRFGKHGFYETEALHANVAIGLIGGIAMGKTTAAQFFANAGTKIIDTDHIARDLTAPGPILDQITQHFGAEVLASDGTLNRRNLRKIIFENPEGRKWLEALLHPLIRQQAEQEAKEAPGPYSIVAIPLLKQREDYAFLQKIIAIITPKDLQTPRLMARDHISEAEAESIIATQPSIEDFTRIADIVIENNGTEAELMVKLQAVYERLAREG